MAEQAVVSVEAAGVPCAVVVAWVGRGEALAGTDPAGARAAYERAAEIARRTGNRLFVGVATPKIAEILVRLGDPKAALRGFRDMLQPFAASLDVAFLSAALGNLIVLFERLGEPVAAATLYGALSHVGGSDAFVPELVTADSRLRQELGEPGYRAARSRGEAMSAADAEAFAIAEIFRLDAEGPQDVSDQSLSSP